MVMGWLTLLPRTAVETSWWFSWATVTARSSLESPILLQVHLVQSPWVTSTAIQDKNLVVATQAGLYLLLGNGNGTFQNPFLVGPPSTSVVSVDVNGDGKSDIVSANSISIGGLSVLYGNGNATFQPPVTYGSTSSFDFVRVGDFEWRWCARSSRWNLLAKSLYSVHEFRRHLRHNHHLKRISRIRQARHLHGIRHGWSGRLR